jgi:hypothetical protein
MRTGFRPYATVGPVTLHSRVTSSRSSACTSPGHDGAQPQQPVQGGKRIGLLGSRARDTDGQGAADIVVDPTGPVRSPSPAPSCAPGTYALYCDHVDQYLVVEPGRAAGLGGHAPALRGAPPGGGRPGAGRDHGRGLARPRPAVQVAGGQATVAPHWPHVHVEVVDPSLPDRPSSGSCD